MHTTQTRWCGVSREISREPGQRRGVIPGALTNDSPRSLTGCSLNKKEKRQRSMSFHKCKCFICESGRWNLVQLKFQIKCINTSTAIVRLWIMENSIIHLERLFYFTGYQEKKRLVNLLDKSQLALRGKKNLYVKTYNKAIKHNILLRINEACVPVQMSIGLYFSQVSDVSELWGDIVALNWFK